MSARQGLVLEVDRTTPPIVFHHGEGFRFERLPSGSRVVYPNEPIEPIEDVDSAIRHALDNPLGDSPPLAALLTKGMKLTIAFDDISLPLPQNSFMASLSLDLIQRLTIQVFGGKGRETKNGLDLISKLLMRAFS